MGELDGASRSAFLMGKRHCSGCARLRASVQPAWRSCNHDRLCRTVDVALIVRYPGNSIGSYQERAKEIELGQMRAYERFQAGEAFPVSGPELLASCAEVHRAIFLTGDPIIAGALRRQDCTFGQKQHERRGSPPETIQAELRQFHPGYPPQTVNEAAWWGARLLQRFFAIHPFVDGNGRTARLLLTWGIEESGDLRVREDWHTRGEERKYIRALEFAHARDPKDNSPAPGANHLRLLSEYLRARIAALAPEDLLEIEEFDE